MSFIEPIFGIFLLLTIGLYSASSAAAKLSRKFSFLPIITLLVCSLFFYGFFRLDYLFLLLIPTALIAYYSSYLMTINKRKWLLLLVGVSLMAGPLLIFKYYDFLARVLFISSSPLGLALPLGISFFTFQNISYIVGRYRGGMPPARNFVHYLTYISFFPQLVAGPIVTAGQFLPQLDDRTRKMCREIGIITVYLLSGYLKKAVLADRLGAIVDPVYASPGSYGSLGIGTAVLAYSLQIYFDFSGYSDMALGLGRIFGFKLPENFNFPYSARGFREFWRRWHITLSMWLREHIYVPLGGSRRGPAVLVFSLLATMALGGLWHGAHWNFVFWGLAHGLLLVIERFIPDSRASGRFYRSFYLALTFILVTLLWIPFRAGLQPAHGLADRGSLAWDIFRGLFSLRDGPYSESSLRFTLLCYAGLVLAAKFYEPLRTAYLKLGPLRQGVLAAFGALAVTLLFFQGDSSAFIYFVF